MKVFTIIMGFIVLIGGIACLFVPGAAFATWSIIIAAIIAVVGLALIINYFLNRKQKTVTGWDLFGGIVTFALGLLLGFNTYAHFLLDAMIVYVFGAGVVVVGILRIVAAVNLKKLADGSMWVWLLILGILIILLGIYCLFHPTFTLFTIGYMVAFFVIMSGVNLITSGFSMKASS